MIHKILKRVRSSLIWLYYFCRFAVRQFYRQRGLQIASSLSYTTLLSLVPLIIVMYGFLDELPVFEDLGNRIQVFIIDNFVPAFGDTIQEFLGGFSDKASQMTISGLAILIIITLLLLATIENALNVIWHVRVQRHPASRFLVYWAILTLGPLLVGVGMFMTSYVLSLSIVSDAEATLGLRTQLLSWTPFLSSAVAFTLLYILMPNCMVSHRHAIIGGIIAAILFEIAKYAFGVYISSFSTYQDLYGAIAVIPVFFIWIYTSWVVIILGAHITFCLSAFRLSNELMDRAGPDWTFTDTCRVIRALWVGQKSGQSMSVKDISRAGVKLPHFQINEIINALHSANWIQADSKGGWILSRDMSELTLMDLYRIIPNRIRLQSEKFFEDDTMQLNQLIQTYNENLTDVFSVPFKTILPSDKEDS